MHGLGNDFVIFDARKHPNTLTTAQIQEIADRHHGIGCDQLIAMEASKSADLFMHIYNPDGSEAEACGNATRCVAHRVMSAAGQGECTIETLGGFLKCRMLANDLVEVDMGVPQLNWADIPLAQETDPQNLNIGQENAQNPVGVGVGNPHCVFFVENIDDIAVETLGPVFEHHELFPNRTNVEFAQILSPTSIRMRVWERSAGITLACGSATCATIVAAVQRGLTERKAEVIVDGGTLQLEWRESDSHILMTGPVAYVFEGALETP